MKGEERERERCDGEENRQIFFIILYSLDVRAVREVPHMCHLLTHQFLFSLFFIRRYIVRISLSLSF